MKKTLIWVAIIFLFLPSSSQINTLPFKSFQKNKRFGKKWLKVGANAQAAIYLRAAAQMRPGKKSIERVLAPVELSIRNYAAAEELFRSLVSKDKKEKRPEWRFWLGLSLLQQEKYNEALSYLNEFRKKGDEDKHEELLKRCKIAIESCKYAQAAKDSPTLLSFSVNALQNGINTADDESSVALLSRRSFIFSRHNITEVNNLKQPFFKYASKLYESKFDEKEWKENGLWSAFPQLKDNEHIFSPSLSEDGKELYFSSCVEEKPLKLRCDIYRSVFSDSKWQKPEKLGSQINLNGANNIWPCPGRAPGGEEALYFCSNKNPGKGYDIFCAIKNPDGTFQKAKTLGLPINTRYDEISPYYEYETNTLYFSSNGRTGMGGYDVYAAKRLVIGDFLEPGNMGFPINSGADDFGFVYNSKNNTGLLVSNRKSVRNNDCATCNDDIWLVESFKLYPAVKGEILVLRGGLKQLMTEGNINLFNLTDNNLAATGQVTNGLYFFDLETDKDYKLTVKVSGGSKEFERIISTKGITRSDTFNINFVLDEIEEKKQEKVNEEQNLVGSKITTVFWDYDKFQLTSSAPDSLKKVVDFYFAHPEYIIEVGSHTDNKGDDLYNLRLSERRGAAVIKYLLSKKIPSKNLLNNPYGESKPLAPNTTPDGKDNPEGRALNRRTEFRVYQILKK
ncbi:MAG: OmpA family protein [Chitinophagales bacterium]|nr:OmpA family protein [Chitinophagales bacterium]